MDSIIINKIKLKILRILGIDLLKDLWGELSCRLVCNWLAVSRLILGEK